MARLPTVASHKEVPCLSEDYDAITYTADNADQFFHTVTNMLNKLHGQPESYDRK
jgi:hypothetical protein